MTRLLFDTTFLIDTERSGENLDDVINDDDDIAIAAITVAELRVGTLLAAPKHKSPGPHTSKTSSPPFLSSTTTSRSPKRTPNCLSRPARKANPAAPTT